MLKATVVLIENNATRGMRVANILRDLTDIKTIRICSDLCEGFNVIEHHPPSLVLFCEMLSKRPEFEAIETLCRCLGVRLTPYSFSIGRILHRQGLDFAADKPDIIHKISKFLFDPTIQPARATAGLLKPRQKQRENKIVLIGSSTGGLEALLVVLSSFPEKCPPTIIVQHTSSGFSSGFAQLLNNKTAPLVKIATDGEVPEQGKVLIAPSAGSHLRIERKPNICCRLRQGDRNSGHRPSIDTLFSSATPIAGRIVGTILTGMGRDGAAGLLELRKAGAITFGQDKASSIVYGMPKVAADIGAVDKVLPLNRIGPAILKTVFGGITH